MPRIRLASASDLPLEQQKPFISEVEVSECVLKQQRSARMRGSEADNTRAVFTTVFGRKPNGENP
jgi:hypothetical protein